MELNGIDAKDLNLFKDIKIDNLPEELNQTAVNPSTLCEMQQANIIANIPARFSETTFNDIDPTLAAKVKDFALQNSDRVFILFGSVGLGKTSAQAAAIHERKIKGLDCGYYFSIRFLLPTLRNCRSFSAQENELSFYRRLSTVAFLCLDEVGTCPSREEEKEFLTTVLSARYDNELPTFIATNDSPFNFKLLISGDKADGRSYEELKAYCGELDKKNPVLNRLKSVAIPYTLTGESYRTRG